MPKKSLDYVIDKAMEGGRRGAREPMENKSSEDIEEAKKRIITRIEFPESGGIMSHLKGYDYPYPGLPWQNFVDKLNVAKKVVRVPTMKLYRYAKKHKIRALFHLPMFIRQAGWLLKAVHQTIGRKHFKKERYSRPVREVHRLFDILIERSNSEGMEDKVTMLRDIVCMFLEFDAAYRWRMQDIAEEINKDELKLTEADKEFCSGRSGYTFGFEQQDE